MNGIRVITLDLDDTLWAIGPVIRRAETVLWSWFGERYPRITAHWSPERVDALRQEVMAEHADRAHDLRFLRRTVMQRMASAAGYDAVLADEAFAVFDRERNTVELFPDVLPALERLRRNYRLLALTNGNASLEKIGIDHLFDGSVAAAEVGAAKPDARIFHAARERSGVQPGEVLHVGDHPRLDVEGARAAGFRTAWMNRSDMPWPADLSRPDAQVAQLSELADLLDGRADAAR